MTKDHWPVNMLSLHEPLVDFGNWTSGSKLRSFCTGPVINRVYIANFGSVGHSVLCRLLRIYPNQTTFCGCN